MRNLATLQLRAPQHSFSSVDDLLSVSAPGIVTRREGGWTWSISSAASPDGRPLDDHINAVLSAITGAAIQLKELLEAEGVDGRWFCFHERSSGGGEAALHLSTDALAGLVATGCDLYVDIYQDDEDA